MSERSINVKEALNEAQEIRKSIDELCLTQERALLRSLGIEPDTSLSDESD